MAQHLKMLFTPLRWQERLCYIALMLLVVADLSWWRLSSIALALFAGTVLLKMVTLRQWGRPDFSRRQQLGLLLMATYWLMLVVSSCCSADRSEGFFSVATQLPMLVFPLLFLVDDSRYLSRTHIVALFRLMVAVLVLRFAICIVVDAIQYLQGTSWSQLTNWEFDPLGLHHNYLALYIDCALAFLYCDLNGRWRQLSCGQRLLHLAPIPLLVAYLLISGSRSGLVTLFVLIFACLLHQTFFRHQWKLALGAGAIVVMLVVGSYLAFPKIYWRFTEMYTEFAAGRQGDDRPMLVRCGLDAARQHPLFGYGTGDYLEALQQSYARNHFDKGLAHHYDAHNQFMETLVANGLVGLALLLALLLLPAATALHTRRERLLILLMLTAILMQLLFESMLDRQMGVQFIALLLPLLLCLTSHNQTTES